ncbi:MAG: hypothetical protein Q9214_000889 [Letrouitia sp. 1 TL-2023]
MHKRRTYDGEDALLRQRAFGLLGYSLVALLWYYVLRIIHLAIAETRARITAAYFLTYILTYGLLTFANVCAIAIACRISHFQLTYLGKSRTWGLASRCQLTALAALGLYSFAMYAATWFLTLQNVQGSVQGTFAILQIKLDAAFEILYLVTVILLSILALLNLGCKSFKVDFYFLAVIVLLLIRSAADTHIVLKYGLHKHIAAKKVRAVEEVLYGLPSVVIYYSLERLSLPVSLLELYPAIRSKLLRQGRAVIRKDFNRRRVDAANGGPALPNRAEILQEIEQRPLAYLPISTQSVMSEWPPVDVQLLLSKHYEDLLMRYENI